MATDQRQSARKILKVRAVLALDGQAPVQVRTGDISASGVSLTVPHPLEAGHTGQVAFDLLVEGKSFPLRSRVKVMYSMFSNGEFKAGFQFLSLDVTAVSQLARFLR